MDLNQLHKSISHCSQKAVACRTFYFWLSEPKTAPPRDSDPLFILIDCLCIYKYTNLGAIVKWIDLICDSDFLNCLAVLSYDEWFPNVCYANPNPIDVHQNN